MDARFAWKQGARFNADAQHVGEALTALHQDNGGALTARVVVDAARPIESPLHACFEWDDLRAAELYRENQARQVLASIRVVSQEHGGEQLSRVYVNVIEQVGDEMERRYVPLSRIATDADLYRQVLKRAAMDLQAFEDRYKQFVSLREIAREARTRIESEITEPAA